MRVAGLVLLAAGLVAGCVPEYGSWRSSGVQPQRVPPPTRANLSSISRSAITTVRSPLTFATRSTGPWLSRLWC